MGGMRSLPCSLLLAVFLASPAGASEETIVRTLEECGALLVESAEGTWSEGHWSDFDPTSRPNLIGGLEFARRADIESRPTP